MADDATPWGPSGKTVYDRTYSRTKPDGSKETWSETVKRVVEGNLALVYGPDTELWSDAVCNEAAQLTYYMENFALLPAGRHLWASGVTAHLSNCHTAHWGSKFSRHFQFTSDRLFEGGGVGANYSSCYLSQYGPPLHKVELSLTADHAHPDFGEMEPFVTGMPDIFTERYMVEDSREGWSAALVDLIDAFFDPKSMSGYRWYDASAVRPSGSELKTSGGTASGPAPLLKMLRDTADVLNNAYNRGFITPIDVMSIDHAIAEAVVAGGTRRSARMAALNWDDPYIMEFLRCKQDTGKHWTTNISVAIDNEFLEQLKYEGTAARSVHETVCRAMLENGEPGYLNLGLARETDPDVVVSNPCGEQIMCGWDACNLGHVNLDWFYDASLEQIKEAHRLMTRFLIRATNGAFNDPEQQETVRKNRRIGVGHFGVQGYWAKNGVKYSAIPAHSSAKFLLESLYQAVREEADSYSAELGIPAPVKVTTVAPTGSIAKLPGVTEGIHPLYARWFERRIRFSMRDEAQFDTVMEAQMLGYDVEDDIYDSSGMTKVVVYPTEDILMAQVRNLGYGDDVVQSADELTAREMLDVQKLYQRYWADNAVSYTVNVAEGSLTQEQLSLLLRDFLPYLKGTTIMVDESRPQAPYTRITRGDYEKATVQTVADGSDECKTGACPVR